MNLSELMKNKKSHISGSHTADLENSDLIRIRNLICKIGTDGYKDGSSTKKGYLYHPIPFTEFTDLNVHKTACICEYKIINRDIPILADKKVLEIGCANGYFAFNLAKNCKEVVAYEGDNRVWEVNEEIRKYKKIKNITFVNEYFNDKIAANIDDDFDIALMLNVHMWIFKQIGEQKTLDMMKSLASKTKVLYFQTAHKDSGGMFKIDNLENKEQISDYLYSAGFSKVEHLLSNTLHRSPKKKILGKVKHFLLNGKNHETTRELFKCSR